MRFIVYLTAGLVGGILGGMGMGGGTVLIPILTMFCGVEQKLAQSVNLFSFLPMAILSLKVHASNKLLQPRGTQWMIPPAVLFSVIGGIFVPALPKNGLRVAFGIFLCALSVFQLRTGLKSVLAQKNAGKKEKSAKEGM